MTGVIEQARVGAEITVRLVGTGYDFTDVTEARAAVIKPDGSEAVIVVQLADLGLGDDGDEVLVRMGGNVDMEGTYRVQLYTREAGQQNQQIGKAVRFRAEQRLIADVWA